MQAVLTVYNGDSVSVDGRGGEEVVGFGHGLSAGTALPPKFGAPNYRKGTALCPAWLCTAGKRGQIRERAVPYLCPKGQAA